MNFKTICTAAFITNSAYNNHLIGKIPQGKAFRQINVAPPPRLTPENYSTLRANKDNIPPDIDHADCCKSNRTLHEKPVQASPEGASESRLPRNQPLFEIQELRSIQTRLTQFHTVSSLNTAKAFLAGDVWKFIKSGAYSIITGAMLEHINDCISDLPGNNSTLEQTPHSHCLESENPQDLDKI